MIKEIHRHFNWTEHIFEATYLVFLRNQVTAAGLVFDEHAIVKVIMLIVTKPGTNQVKLFQGEHLQVLVSGVSNLGNPLDQATMDQARLLVLAKHPPIQIGDDTFYAIPGLNWAQASTVQP